MRYANIEKELYAVVFGCERFHMYTYGKPFVVESDHKPLESIVAKPLYLCPPRLQRMLLRLQRYSLTIKYVPGKDMQLADTLSRAPLNDKAALEITPEVDNYIIALISNLPICDDTLKRIRFETDQDPELSAVKEWVLRGCTPQPSSSYVEKYKHLQEELTFGDGVLLKGAQIVIPKTLRKEMLEKIHYAHQGIERCKERAREVLFWPGMNNEITQMIKRCDICLRYRNSNPREPMIIQDPPTGPWRKVGLDIYTLRGDDWLLVVYYFSKFVEVVELRNLTSGHIIKAMKRVFATHGIPEEIVADQGTQFSSREFLKFSQEWNFKRSLVSPKYQQGNGQAERSIQTVKKLLNKAYDDGKDVYLCLLELNNTPSQDLPAPSQLLMSRRLRGILPVRDDHLEPHVMDTAAVRAAMRKRQEIYKKYYDRSTRPLRDLRVGEEVQIQKFPSSTWTPAKVVERLERPRSYGLETKSGHRLERNRKHIICREETEGEQEEVEEALTEGKDSGLDAKEEGYFTRSGRLVRKPQCLDL